MPGSNALAYSYKASVTEKMIYKTCDGQLLIKFTKSSIDFRPMLKNFLISIVIVSNIQHGLESMPGSNALAYSYKASVVEKTMC
jgi:hypothetical protein